MIETALLLERLPGELRARLESDGFAEDLPILEAESDQVRQWIAREQGVVTRKAGKIGAAVVVLAPAAEDPYPELALGPLRLLCSFQVIEHVELNYGPSGTRKSRWRIARWIVDQVKPLRLVGLTTEFGAGKPVIEPIDLSGELGPLVRAVQVNLHCYEAGGGPEEVVSLPQFGATAEAEPRLTVSCATEGAEIWVTLDDSYPGPQNPAAVRYEAPLAVTETVVARACGYRAGWVPSAVARETVSRE